MKFVYLLALSLFVLQQAPTPPEDYPGQRNHGRPPEAYFCSSTAKDVAHKCECKRMIVATPEDPVCEFQEPPESPQCKVWCHKDKCLCPVTCKIEGHHHAH